MGAHAAHRDVGSPAAGSGRRTDAARGRLADGYDAGAGEVLRARARRALPTRRSTAPIGPHRRIDWRTTELARVKVVKNRFGGTVNDVVLATVAGAVRRFFMRRRVPTEGVDFRTVVPVSVRTTEERGQSCDNRASAWILSLPIDERDPRRRSRACADDRELEAHAPGASARRSSATWPSSRARSRSCTWACGSCSAANPYNLIVTNVPGPPVPLYLLGARMRRRLSAGPARSRTRRSGSRSSATAIGSSGASTATGTWCPTCTTSRTTSRASFEELARDAALEHEVRSLAGRRISSR